MSSAPVLAQPDFEREFIIQCDAYKVGVGGVLFQYDDQGQEQRNYTVMELECLAEIVSVNRFRPYIEGLPFRIITDHSSLKWFMSQKDLSGRLARWSLKLQRYTFGIEHRKGSLNIVPDCLSRMGVGEITTNKLPLEIDPSAPEFEEEEYLNLRKNVLDNEESLPDLCVSHNLVLKRVSFRLGSEEDENNIWRIWLPNSLVSFVLKSAHNSSLSCHGGFMKTLSRIRQKYFWPSMVKDIKIYICEQLRRLQKG